MKKILIGLMVLLMGQGVFAKENFMEALITQYPVVMGTNLMDCFTCHTRDKWMRNAYGLDLEKWLFNSRDVVDGDWDPERNQYVKEFIMKGMMAIEHIDSDNDGYSNRLEIMNLSNPGLKTSIPGLNE